MATDAALDLLAAQLREAGKASAFVASPQASNEDAFAFKALCDELGGKLDFRVGDPQLKLSERVDTVLQRADRNPNTQGCLDLGLARDGVATIVDACRRGEVKALVLQGPELLRQADAREAVGRVPFVAVMATHEEAALELAHLVLPAAVWAESDGSFTNFGRRVQRYKRAFAAPGEARPRWELAAGVVRRLGGRFAAASARDVFALVAQAIPDYATLSFKALGATGRTLATEAGATAAPEARP